MVMTANVCNYLYQILMGRMLSVEEYGTLNALLSLLVISSVPGMTITLMVSKYIAEYNATGEQYKVGHFLRRSLAYISIFTGIVTVVGLIVSPLIKSFLMIEEISYVWFIIIAVGLAFILPVATGAVQGLKKFWGLGFLNLINPVIKLILGVLLVGLGFKVNGALGALVIGALLSVLIGFMMLKGRFKINGDKDVVLGRKEVIKYSIPVMVVTFCISVLTNIDMIMIKHYFSPQESGLYGSAVIFGRAIFYFPAAIVMAMFPLVAEAKALKEDAYSSLKKALIYATVLCGAGVAVLNLFPELIIKLLFGARYLPAIPYIKLISLAMLPLCLLNILVNFNLAMNNTKLTIVSLVLGSIIEGMLIVMYHSTVNEVLYILMGIGLILLIINFIATISQKSKKNLRLSKQSA